MSRRRRGSRRGEVDLKTVGCAGLVAALLCCGGGLGGAWTGGQVYLHGHEVTTGVLAALDESADAQLALGRPIDLGWTAVGTIETDDAGGGRADLHLPVSGPLGSGRVRVVSVREDGAWRAVVMRLQVGDLDLDLLAAAREAEVAARSEDVAEIVSQVEEARGRGRFEEASDLCDQALDMEKDDAHVWSVCGSVALDAGDPGLAERRLKRALALDPDDLPGRADMGRVQSRLGKYADCVDSFTLVLRTDAAHADAWYQRSHCYAELGEKRKARAGAREACSLGSDEGCALAETLN